VNDERIRQLLRNADSDAGPPALGPIRIARLRQRVFRRRLVAAALPAAAVVLIGTAVWNTYFRPHPGREQEQKIATLETQVRQLQAQTDAVLRLVREVAESDRRERRLDALETELAGIGDPMKEIERQVDKAAFVMVYEADRLYQQLNQTESAVEAYKEVIRLFPRNRWANVARERLSEIQEHRFNKAETEGETKCEPRNV
jgi:uncharacterized protein YoxC